MAVMAAWLVRCLMKKKLIFITCLFWASSHAFPGYAFTEQQSIGLYRHGIWEWSIKSCPNIVRNKGYWYALKEVGGFENADQIIKSENSRSFIRGWNYMAENAKKYGREETCKYAAEQWPAVLWSE